MNNDEAPPIVEPRTDERAPALTLRSLEERIRQQEILADLGVRALQGASFEQLLTETAQTLGFGDCARTSARFLSIYPLKTVFLCVRAWAGNRALSASPVSVPTSKCPAGFALRTGEAGYIQPSRARGAIQNSRHTGGPRGSESDERHPAR